MEVKIRKRNGGNLPMVAVVSALELRKKRSAAESLLDISKKKFLYRCLSGFTITLFIHFISFYFCSFTDYAPIISSLNKIKHFDLFYLALLKKTR